MLSSYSSIFSDLIKGCNKIKTETVRSMINKYKHNVTVSDVTEPMFLQVVLFINHDSISIYKV